MKWNTVLYDQAHDFVARYGEEVLSYLDPKPGERILDLGCGTGDLTYKIFCSGAVVVGMDSSPEMLSRARSKYPGLDFLQMDARELYVEIPYDAVFSNAVLHWIPEKELVIRNIYSSLKEGGRMVAEFGGKGCVSSLISALKTSLASKGYKKNSELMPWYYPSIAEYSAELEKQGFTVIFAELFDRPTALDGTEGLKNWYRMFTGDFFAGIPKPDMEDILTELNKKLEATHFAGDKWLADYRRLRIVAIKD
jgi:trans-aconitate methyltransferase